MYEKHHFEEEPIPTRKRKSRGKKGLITIKEKILIIRMILHDNHTQEHAARVMRII